MRDLSFTTITTTAPVRVRDVVVCTGIGETP